MRDVWTTAFGKEFGNLAQGDDKTGEKGTNSIFVMSHNDIANIPKGRTVTYGRIVIDYRPQKADPNRVRITAGGNLIKDYPGELTTRTADLTRLACGRSRKTGGTPLTAKSMTSGKRSGAGDTSG
jgi:hypothetical protein